jgi:hypothetical protein
VSNASALQALEYEVETVFGEDVTTFATHRWPVVGMVDMSGIKHDKVDSARLVQRMQEQTEDIIGPQGGSFKVKLWLSGHGTTTVGSPTVDATETLIAYLFGNATGGNATGTLSAAASTTFTGGTALAPTTTASGTFAAGSLFVPGAKGDGRCDGQMNVVNTHITTALTPMIALPAAPTNGDVLLPCVNFCFPEDPTSAACVFPGLRFRVRTANLAKELHGVYPMGLAIGGQNPGETPFLEATFGVSWWRYTATSGVSAVASNQYNPAPVAAGSFHVGVVGSTTRALKVYRDLKIDITYGMAPKMGPGSPSIYGACVGAQRIPSTIKATFKVDADTATATPALDGLFTSGTALQLLATLNPSSPGSRVGWYMPNARVTGARPVQLSSDKYNQLALEVTAGTGTTTTSDLTLSAFRMAFA